MGSRFPKERRHHVHSEDDEEVILKVDSYRAVVRKRGKRYLKTQYDDMSRPHYEAVVKIKKRRMATGHIRHEVFTGQKQSMIVFVGNPITVRPIENGG